MRSPERDITLAQAEKRATAYASGRGWEIQLRSARPGSEFGAWQCHLLDAAGHPLPGGQGAGKGGKPTARVGALCEAIEHHLTQDLDFYRPRLRPAGQVADTLAATGDRIASLLAEQAEQPLACLPYRPLRGEEPALDLPLALAIPEFIANTQARRALGDTADYTPLVGYSTNNGAALGASFEEAALHALNEVVERDALSLLLCQAFWGHDYRPILIDPHTLPAELAVLYWQIQAELGEDVVLLDLTTDLGMPTVLAYIAPHTGRGHHGRGLGTSLSEPHAIYRALNELLQLEQLGDVTPPQELAHLGDIDTGLLRIGQFDLSAHLSAATQRPAAAAPAPRTATEQLHEVCTTLRRHGYVPYSYPLSTGPLLSVAHIAVPGLERIMTVLQGYLALPGQRGLAAIHSTTAPAAG